MNKDTYITILRILSTLVAFSLWMVSMNFSINGFGIQIPEYAWVGLVLGFSVTIIELIWNKQGSDTNLTIMFVGVLAYIYGIYTNMIGISDAQGLSGSITDNLGSTVFAFILAVVLEITPEPLFVWGITGLVDSGDFLTNLFGKGMNVRLGGGGNSNNSHPPFQG